MKELVTKLENGELKAPKVTYKFPLEQAQEAHKLVMNGTLDKVVLVL